MAFLPDKLVFHGPFDDVKTFPSSVEVVSGGAVEEQDGVENSDEDVERLGIVRNQLENRILKTS